MELLIKKIKSKKELSDIPDSLVKDILKEYLLKNKIILPRNPREEKIIIKEIRAELRKLTGRFQIKFSIKKRLDFLEKGNTSDLLKTHASTKERLTEYNVLKNMIKSINPRSVLDIGCGLNPLAICDKKTKYYAYDIKKEELRILSKFFKKHKIHGKTFHKDITKIKEFPKADLCLVLKVLDIIETKGHKKAKELLQNLDCKNFIVSFSTKTLSGKPMKIPKRQWFENLLKSLNKDFKIKKISNEIYYIFK